MLTHFALNSLPCFAFFTSVVFWEISSDLSSSFIILYSYLIFLTFYFNYIFLFIEKSFCLFKNNFVFIIHIFFYLSFLQIYKTFFFSYSASYEASKRQKISKNWRDSENTLGDFNTYWSDLAFRCLCWHDSVIGFLCFCFVGVWWVWACVHRVFIFRQLPLWLQYITATV